MFRWFSNVIAISEYGSLKNPENTNLKGEAEWYQNNYCWIQSSWIKVRQKEYITKKGEAFTFPSQEGLIIYGEWHMTHGLERVLIKTAVEHVLIKIAAIT